MNNKYFPVEFNTNCVTWLIKTKSPSKLQRIKFIRNFDKLKSSNKLIFTQDRASTRWFTNVSKWLNKNLPERWIGRGGRSIGLYDLLDSYISWHNTIGLFFAGIKNHQHRFGGFETYKISENTNKTSFLSCFENYHILQKNVLNLVFAD